MVINSELQKRLRAKYNPDGSSLRKAQLRMVDMLKYFDDYCNEHQLTYWLDAGTLLGAVRHGGFIPWDDDSDIMMPKKDYDKLKKIMLSQPKHDEFVLQCHETDPGYYGAWMVLRDKKSEYIQDSNLHRVRKYRGLQIDIIACENHFIWFLYVLCGKYQHKFINKALYNNKNEDAPFRVKWAFVLFHRLLIPLFHFISLPFAHKYVKYYYGAGWDSRRYLKNIYPVGRINFEGVELSAPANPEGYLADEYRNWKEVPSEDKIKTHNVEVIFR